MKTLLFLIGFVPLISQAQDTIKIDSTKITSIHSLTGMYFSGSKIPEFSAAYSGDNGIRGKNLFANINTSYSLTYSNNIKAHEIQNKINICYKNVFLLHVFNSSLIRSITNENSFGAGVGKWWKKSSISYAALYQNTNYASKIDIEVIRHSLRVKCKYDTKKIALSCELYYQPNMLIVKDFIIYGVTKLYLLPNEKINFTISDNINYRSFSNVKMVHTLTLGISFSFSK